MKDYEIFKFENDINEIVVFVTNTEDFYYIQNQSLLFDIIILLKTVPVVLFGKGAY